MKCILCKSSNTTQISTINASDLIFLYKKAFNVNIEHIITSDVLYYHCKECDLRFFTLQDGMIPSGDNEFYNALNKLEWYYMSEKNEYHFAKNFIKDSSKILEVGCGKAAFREFLPKDAQANYVGLEFSTDAKKMAKNANIQNIALEDFAKTNANCFDTACSFQVLEHVINPYNFIKDQITCLNNGGGES